MAAESRAEVGDGGMGSDSVVPHNDGARLITGTYMEVGTLADVVKEEVEEVPRFFLPETSDAAGEALVDIESLLASHWMYADERVLDTDE